MCLFFVCIVYVIVQSKLGYNVHLRTINTMFEYCLCFSDYVCGRHAKWIPIHGSTIHYISAVHNGQHSHGS